ncbi:UDP-N-acetylglucosamine 1-carboxyvinyltransferase [Kitasatospora sp. MMS16-BH015]|uniref:hypothetical protein n=1 Tax=Kitasatospora sp. MMS16-BH015 TaxID=2018025 RepID=UPI000CA0F4A7|nr:hypothetical protein [Kitasatospora sp. MMS16-BH015]AUG78268.1 UDP-N-acetylglucosamine 1-carboxyvinyltransferase [Kitasatospora sp. MMS16-BH015]
MQTHAPAGAAALLERPAPPRLPADCWEVERTGHPAGAVVRPAGFKHLLVPLLAASCLAERPWRITNVPDIADTRVLGAVLREVGAEVHHDAGAQTLTAHGAGVTGQHIPEHLSGQVHGAVYLLPALLAATGRVASGSHGGCSIGDGAQGQRPLAHLAAVMERFGARCLTGPGQFAATAPADGLRGAVIDLAEFAVREPVTGTLTGPHYSGATKTALLLGAVAKGTTLLRNPYPKADVTELARALGAAGVPVRITPEEIELQGRGGPLGAAELRLPSDLMEVLTYVSLAVCLDTETRVLLDRPEAVRAGLAPELACLEQMGVPLSWDGEQLRVRPVDRVAPVDAIAASHLLYSDAQPLLAPVLLRGTGPSRLTDTVWGARFGYAEGLRRLGADLTVDGSRLLVRPSRLRPVGGDLYGGDLRAVMALVLGALAAGGRYRVHGVGHLARGYAHLPEKLRLFGAEILEPGPNG